jgi:hypothetical protein
MAGKFVFLQNGRNRTEQTALFRILYSSKWVQYVYYFYFKSEHDFFEEAFNLINLSQITCVSKLSFFCSESSGCVANSLLFYSASVQKIFNYTKTESTTFQIIDGKKSNFLTGYI